MISAAFHGSGAISSGRSVDVGRRAEWGFLLDGLPPEMWTP